MSTNRTLLHLQNLPTHRSHSFVKSAIFERGLCRDPKMTQVGHFWVAKTSGSLLGPGSSLGRPPQHSFKEPTREKNRRARHFSGFRGKAVLCSRKSLVVFASFCVVIPYWVTFYLALLMEYLKK